MPLQQSMRCVIPLADTASMSTGNDQRAHARAAAATTVVSRRSDDAAPVTIRQSLLGATAVRRATTVLDRTSKLQNVTWSL